MEYGCKVTVNDKKLFQELQQQYCAVPDSGKCPCFHVGDEFLFYRNDERDDYWHAGAGTLVKSGAPDEGCLQSPGPCTAERKACPSAPRHEMPSAAILYCTSGRQFRRNCSESARQFQNWNRGLYVPVRICSAGCKSSRGVGFRSAGVPELTCFEMDAFLYHSGGHPFSSPDALLSQHIYSSKNSMIVLKRTERSGISNDSRRDYRETEGG